MTTRPARVLFFRPSLDQGGADRVTITVLRQLDRAHIAPSIALAKATGALIGEVPADVPVHDLGAPRLAASLPALVRVVRATRPDVIFSTSSGCNALAVAARALSRVPARVVLSERNAVLRPSHHPLRRALEVPLKRATYARAALVTAVSDGVADDLRRVLGLPHDAVRVIGNPVVTADFDARAAEPVTHPWFDAAAQAIAPVVLAVGRMVPAKAYPTLLDAFARVRAQRPARLVVLGDGPERAAIETAIADRGLTDDVALLGFDPNPYRYMARAALLLQASIAEGLPGTIIQSMAAGIPVVVTDCDHGPREVVRPGIDGYLVPVGDAAGLAARVGELLADPARRRAMGAAGQAMARQRFTVARAMAHYQAALLGEPEPTAS